MVTWPRSHDNQQANSYMVLYWGHHITPFFNICTPGQIQITFEIGSNYNFETKLWLEYIITQI